ncbi:MAG: transcription antitermination factor NusB, partial [Deltaproteobacteria bacterium]|nr:transcription antitermination factor NusB [Deltaproteobacteria bacterium]
MGSRRKGREAALQMLYQFDLSGGKAEEVFANFWRNQEGGDAPMTQFSENLVKGVLAQKEALDDLIAKHATHWKLSRMPVVDKNVLRLAAFELKDSPDTPLKVILNEAIEIAKKFGSEE